MARYNLSFMMTTYTDDFGNEYKNQPIKIEGNAPALGLVYEPRALAICSGKQFFKPRYLRVTFEDGRVLKYPMPDFVNVTAMVIALKAQGAVCIDYIGEEWSFVPTTSLKLTLNFKATPYQNLPPKVNKITWTFDYDSSITGVAGLSNGIKLKTQVNEDDIELNACQLGGMLNPTEGSGICTPGGVISPRKFIIQAEALDTAINTENFQKNKVIRNAVLSAKSAEAIKAVATAIAPCAQCLGYQGESIFNIHTLIGS